MKKIFTYILGAAAILLSVSSCDAILEQESPSTFDGATVFANYTLAEGTIFGVTEAFCEVNSYRGRFLPWYGYNTDIEWYNSYKPGDGKSDIAIYNIATNNSQLNTNNNPYVLMYTGIERANLIIEGLREYGNTDTDKDMAYLLGEVLTLRAMIYYDLTKAWGDVPARFHSIQGDEDIYAKKESRDEIYKQILADLEEAIPYLYYPNKSKQTATNDRVNKVFAEGLYARIVLAASGYAQRPEDGKVGTGDTGSNRKTNDPALQASVLYPKALSYLQDAITNGGCSLYGDFEKYWYKMNNLDNVNFDGETIYIIPFGEGRGRWNFTFAINASGATINGYTLNRGGDAGPVPTVYFDYADGDVRRDISCVNYSWTKNGAEPAGIGKWFFGKYRYEWMKAVPYSGGNDDGVKPVVMRYADILLMAAEIANEQGDLSAAKQYLLQVRSRAFKGNESLAEAYVASIGSKDEMFEAIVDERALEFCGEFLRKGDLIRWGMLTEKLDEAKEKMFELRDLSGQYSYLSGNVWFKYDEESGTAQFYGFNKGENGAKGDDWNLEEGYVTKYDDAKNTGFYTERINGIYYRNPEQYMFWPIFDDTISNSQGALVNDYGY